MRAVELKERLRKEDRDKFEIIEFIDSYTWRCVGDNEEVLADWDMGFRNRKTGTVFLLEESTREDDEDT